MTTSAKKTDLRIVRTQDIDCGYKDFYEVRNRFNECLVAFDTEAIARLFIEKWDGKEDAIDFGLHLEFIEQEANR